MQLKWKQSILGKEGQDPSYIITFRLSCLTEEEKEKIKKYGGFYCKNGEEKSFSFLISHSDSFASNNLYQVLRLKEELIQSFNNLPIYWDKAMEFDQKEGEEGDPPKGSEALVSLL